jgi:hypothetical protein
MERVGTARTEPRRQSADHRVCDEEKLAHDVTEPISQGLFHRFEFPSIRPPRVLCILPLILICRKKHATNMQTVAQSANIV